VSSTALLGITSTRKTPSHSTFVLAKASRSLSPGVGSATAIVHQETCDKRNGVSVNVSLCATVTGPQSTSNTLRIKEESATTTRLRSVQERTYANSAHSGPVARRRRWAELHRRWSPEQGQASCRSRIQREGDADC